MLEAVLMRSPYPRVSTEQTALEHGLPDPAREVELLGMRRFCAYVLRSLCQLQLCQDSLEDDRDTLRAVAGAERNGSGDVPRVLDDSLRSAEVAQRIYGLQAIEELCGRERGHIGDDPPLSM